MTLKAFAVTEDFEGTGGIVFAKSGIAARRLGANEYADGEFENVKCRRAPWADKYAGQGVPVSVMVENRWHFECSGCGVRIDEDLPHTLFDRLTEDVTLPDKIYSLDDVRDMNLDIPGLEEALNWTPKDIIGDQHTQAFCTASCKESYDAHQAERKRREDRIVARLSAIIKARFPESELIDKEGYRSRVYAYYEKRDGKWRLHGASIPFTFPGSQYGPGTLNYEPDPYRNRRNKEGPRIPYFSLNCANGDVDTFHAYIAKYPPLHNSAIKAKMT